MRVRFDWTRVVMTKGVRLVDETSSSPTRASPRVRSDEKKGKQYEKNIIYSVDNTCSFAGTR